MTMIKNQALSPENLNAAYVSRKNNSSMLGALEIENATESTSDSSGALIVSGGVGVAKNLNVGGTISGANISGINTGDLVIADFGSTPNEKGVSISGQTITIQPASATMPGAVSIEAQSFLGKKTFKSDVSVEGVLTTSSSVITAKSFGLDEEINSTLTGSLQTLASFTGALISFTNSSLISISGIAAPFNGRIIGILNKTGASVTVARLSTATAAHQIETGTGKDISWANNSSLLLFYSQTDSKWHVVGGSGSGGSGLSVGSSLALADSGSIADDSYTFQTALVAGVSAAVTLSVTPFGTVAPSDGKTYTLIGNSDTNSVTIPASDASMGVLGYDVTLAKGQTKTYRYIAALDRFVIL